MVDCSAGEETDGSSVVALLQEANAQRMKASAMMSEVSRRDFISQTPCISKVKYIIAKKLCFVNIQIVFCKKDPCRTSRDLFNKIF